MALEESEHFQKLLFDHGYVWETYVCVVFSTAHMSEVDNMRLAGMAMNGSMVAQRETGYFLKLYEELELNDYPKLTDGLNALIRAVHRPGFRLIEFDQDGPVVEGFQTWEW